MVERCGDCAPCRVGQGMACVHMLVMLPDGQIESCSTDRAVLNMVKAWFAARADSGKFNVGTIEWREGTGRSIFKGRHAPAECKRLGGLHQRFATKSWSDAFECSACGVRQRFNLNFLGGKRVVCDGTKFTKVAA